MLERDIFDRKHRMFVGVHPDFEQKSEGSRYQNPMLIVAMGIEKYQWYVMVACETDSLDDSSFSRNILSFLETQTMDLASQLELQTTIWDVTATVKIKATLHSFGG